MSNLSFTDDDRIRISENILLRMMSHLDAYRVSRTMDKHQWFWHIGNNELGLNAEEVTYLSVLAGDDGKNRPPSDPVNVGTD